MAESETKTSFGKVVERVMTAARKRSTKANPEQVQEIIRRVYPEKGARALNAKEARSESLIENAKKFYVEAKSTGQYVALSKWAKENRFVQLDIDSAKALKIARKDLSLALKAAKLSPDSWIVREAANVQCAESAQALTAVALAPKEARESPHFLFQTASRLAASNSKIESQSTIKAFIAEMNLMKGKDGFDARMFDLDQMLTAVGGMSHVPVPPGVDQFQGVDFSTLPLQVRDLFRAVNSQIADPLLSKPDKLSVLRAFSKQLNDVNTGGFTQANHETFVQLVMRKNQLEGYLESELPNRYRFPRNWFMDNGFPEPKSTAPDFDTRLSESEMTDILRGADADGDTGADQWYELFSDRIHTSGIEARQPSLQEQSQYEEFESLLRYVNGEESSIVGKFRNRWEEDFPRNVVVTRVLTGRANEKELVEDLPRSISTSTLNYETQVKGAPEAIAIEEHTIRDLSAGGAFKYEKDVEYVNTTWLDAAGNPELDKKSGRNLTRAEKWNKDPDVFSGIDAQRMIDAMSAGHGSIIRDEWLVINAPIFSKLSETTLNITRKIEDSARLGRAITPDAAIRQLGVREELERYWKQVTLEQNIPPDKLYNPSYLDKIRGFSPLEIKTLEKLEASKKYRFLRENRQWNEEQQRWKLRRSILAARRYMVGSKRIFSLVGNMSNMPGLEITPSGSDVMQESLEYVMRTELPERFILARFGIGKVDVGGRIMPVEQEELCRLRGVTLDRRDDLKPFLKKDESIPRRRWRTVIDKTKKRFGVRFGQLAVGTLLDSTCPFDYSTWRADDSILKVLQEKYGDGARHMAFGTRLKSLGVYEGEQAENPNINTNLVRRERELKQITERTPSLLFQLIGKDLDTGLSSLHGNGTIRIDVSPGSPEGKRFMMILEMAERRITTEAQFFNRPTFDLGSLNAAGVASDFNDVFDDAIFHALDTPTHTFTAAEITNLKEDYLKIIQEAQRVFREPQAGQTISYFKQFAQRGMPITLTMSDFDLGEADFHRITQSGQRRTDQGDAMPRLEAKNDLIAIVSDQDISMPENLQKTFIPAIKKLMTDINSYKDEHFAESRTGIMVDAIMSHNVAKDTYRGLVQAIPFLPRLLRTIVGQDVGKWYIRWPLEPVRQLAIGYAKLFGQKDLADLLTRNLEEWPKIFGQEFISGAAAVKGEAGNAMLAFEAHKFIEDIEHSGLFTEHKILQRWRDKYKTRVGARIFEGGARYWWVPFGAAIAVGVIIAIQEQGLDSSGKSH